MKEKINKFIIVFSEKVLPVLTIIFWPIIKLFEALTKLPAIVKAVLSGIIWGFGQLLNRQYVKALIFFLLFALILGVEFGTGNYGHEFDLYDDKMPGDEIQEELSNYYPTWYYYNHVDFNPTSSYAYEDYSLLHDVAESNNLTFDEETFLFYDESNNIVEVDNISYTNKDMYEFLGLELRRIEEIEFDNGVEDIKDEADQLATIKVETLVESTLDEMADRDVRLSNTFIIDRQERMEEIATEELIDSGENPDDTNFSTVLDNYISTHEERLQIQAQNELIAERKAKFTEAEIAQVRRQKMAIYYTGYFNSIYNDLYGSRVNGYDSVGSFSDMLQERLTAQGLDMDNDDYNKMLARIYFEYSPETYETVVNQVNNPVYENAGFFVKGVWGVITLGTVSQRTMYQHQILGFLLPASGTQSIEAVSIEFAGHHSTQLLLRGIISSLVLLYILFIYGWNIRDAYKTGKLYKEEGKQNEKDYFAAVYDNSFEYIVLTPALVLVTFITVMPIIFGFLVAFTNYNINHIPPGQLINWVGLRNFVEVFSLTSGSSIDFGGQFWSVFSWTMIWAIFATATCFFGGFIQAVILNNKRIVFRKAWRGILILPWAVPALISQMIFRVIFNDNGYVNQILTRVGVTDLLKDWGMLGRPLAEAGTGIDKFLYFGDQSIQWLSNEANPWFVRIFLIILNIWLGFPFFMALMSGVMTSIDESLYEAASIDGATGFQQFRFITMPLVLFATSPLLVMTFAGNFNNFGVIYFITGGGPGGGTYETAFAGSTDILISWIYTLTVDANVRWYNMASVFSILIFLIIGTLSAWNFTRTRAFKEGD